MPMDWPVILDKKELLGLRVALLDCLVKPQQGPRITMRPLQGQQPPRVYVQARCNATGRVVALALLGIGPITAHRGIPLSHTWAAIIGQFVLVELYDSLRRLAAVPGNGLDALHLGFVLPVRRVDI